MLKYRQLKTDYAGAYTPMQRLFLIIMMCCLMITLSSCTNEITGNHLKLIKKGHQPSIALVISIPNLIHITYTGEQEFENRSYSHPSTIDFKQVINTKATEVLKQSDIVKLYIPQDEASEDLLSSLSYGQKYYWSGGEFLNKDKHIISEWGKYRNIDFIGFVMPNRTYTSSNNTHIFSAKGLKASLMKKHSYRVDHTIVLFDVTNQSIAGTSSHTTEKIYNTYYRKELTTEDLDRIDSDRIKKLEEDDYYRFAHPSLEKEVELATRYDGDDYAVLTKEQIEELDHLFLPMVKENIHEILRELGLARKERG
jgi:hypothetical protein